MVTTVASVTLDFSEGDTASSGSSVMSPVSSTSLTVVMLAFSPSTTRESPLIFTVTNVVFLSALLIAPRVAERDAAESVAENEVMVEIGFTSSAW